MRARRGARLVALAAVLTLFACGDPGPCEPRIAVITDIDETMTTQDEDWLAGHGFPLEPGNLYLADGVPHGSDAVEYKAGVLADLEADGWRFAYAYGNSDTDIEAFREGASVIG